MNPVSLVRDVFGTSVGDRTGDSRARRLLSVFYSETRLQTRWDRLTVSGEGDCGGIVVYCFFSILDCA